MKKSYVVQVTFPDLKVKDAVQDARVEATGFPQAVKRALKEILKRESVKRKRHRRMTVTVSVLEARREDQTTSEAAPVETAPAAIG